MTSLRFLRTMFAVLFLVILLAACAQKTESQEAMKPYSPVLRGIAACATVGNKIYVFGGVTKDGATFITEAYDTSTNIWTRKSSMPTARIALNAVAIENMIYVVGGRNESGVSDVVEVYDTAQDSWRKARPLSFPRWNHMSVLLAQKIYVLGGLIGTGDKRETVDTVEIYDPIVDSWSKGSSIPERKQGAAVAVLQGKIYLAGGLIGSGGLGGKITNTVHVYDLATGKWDKAASMTIARTSARATVIDGKIYVVGGTTGKPTSSIQVYDPAANMWETKQSMQEPRSGHCVESVGRKVIIVGGMTGASTNSLTAVIEEIDI